VRIRDSREEDEAEADIWFSRAISSVLVRATGPCCPAALLKREATAFALPRAGNVTFVFNRPPPVEHPTIEVPRAFLSFNILSA
jgi:hypothetical protein